MAWAASFSSSVGLTIRLGADAGAFVDASGNPSQPIAGAALEVAADESRPSLDPASPPLFNNASRTITVTFDEPIRAIDDPSRVRIEDASGSRILPSAPQGVERIGDTRARISLTQQQSEQVEAAAAAGRAPRIVLPEVGVFSDMSCLPLAGTQRAAMAGIEDNAPPEMLTGFPRLDLGTAVLAMRFSEPVDAAGANASAVSLLGPGLQMPLRGAAVDLDDGADGPANDTLRLLLTPHQKHAAVVANRSGALAAGITDRAVSDLSYLYYGGADAAPLHVVPDTVPPRVLGGEESEASSRPVLGIEARMLTVRFDEYVGAAPTVPGSIALAAGAAAQPAPGERVDVGADSAVSAADPGPAEGLSLEISLSGADAQAAAIRAVTHLSSLAGAFRDASQVGSDMEGPIEMRVVRDLTPPRLDPSSPRLYLGNGTLALAFRRARGRLGRPRVRDCAVRGRQRRRAGRPARALGGVGRIAGGGRRRRRRRRQPQQCGCGEPGAGGQGRRGRGERVAPVPGNGIVLGRVAQPHRGRGRRAALRARGRDSAAPCRRPDARP